MTDIDEPKELTPAHLRLVSSNLIPFEGSPEQSYDVDMVLDEMSIGVYAFMMGHYKRSWVNMFVKNDLSFEGWQRAWMMSMEGLTLAQVEYGKQKISSMEAYPEIPPNGGQFRLLCKSMPEYLHFQTKPSLRIKYEDSPEADARRLDKSNKAFEKFKEVVKKDLEIALKQQYSQHIENLESERLEQMESDYYDLEQYD